MMMRVCNIHVILQFAGCQVEMICFQFPWQWSFIKSFQRNKMMFHFLVVTHQLSVFVKKTDV